MPAEELRYAGLLQLALSHSHNCGDERLIADAHLDVVQIQEHQGCYSGHALVAIDERVILHEMEEVRGRHLEQVDMEVLTAGPRLSHGQRRFEQLNIPPVSRNRVENRLRCACSLLGETALRSLASRLVFCATEITTRS